MLSFHRIRNASYYLQLTRYFTKDERRARNPCEEGPFSPPDGAAPTIPETVPGEPPGRWIGKAVSAFGLSYGQQVEKHQLERLFQGFHPTEDIALVQNAGDPNRRPAFDCTLSAPKSVSAIWSQGGERGQKIAEAWRRAVEDTLAFTQQHFGFTRTGKGGTNLQRADLLMAAFEHGTSREGDPNLHHHGLLLNAVASADGESRALDARPIFHANKVIGAYCQCRFAMHALELQLALERDGNALRVKGFDKRWEELFSKRSKQIKELVGDNASSKAKREATLATRKKKDDKLVSRAELFARWRKEALEAGFSVTQFEHLPKPSAFTQRTPMDRLEETLAWYAPQVTHFTANDLLFNAMLDDIYGVDKLVDVLDDFLATHSELVKLMPNENGYMLYTSREVMEREQELLQTATRLNQQHGAQAKEESLAATIKDREQLPPLRQGMKPGLTVEQQAALEHVTRSDSSIRFLRGRAGTGKTFLLAAASELFKKDGFQVVGAAPSNEAKEQLEKEGIEAHTITSFLADYEVDTSEQSVEVSADWEEDTTTTTITPKTYWKKGLLENGLLGTKLFGTQKVKREGVRWSKTRWKQPVALATKVPRQSPQPYDLTDKHVLLVDEAATANLQHFQKLMKKAADAGATIILCGDERQNTPPDGTISPFDSLARAFGYAVLNDIQRQETDWQRTASRWFSEGRVASALQLYEKNENLTLAANVDEAIEKTITHWLDLDGAKRPADSVMLASTNHAVSQLNRRAQRQRLKKAELRGQPRAIHSIEQSGHHVDKVYEGDRVRFTGNAKISGHRISNNDSATVLYTTGIGGVTFRLDKTDRLGKQIVVTVDPNDFRQIRLGYARTDFKAQGGTFKNVLYLATGGDFHSGFVSVTRHKGQLQIVTLGDLVDDLEDLEQTKFAENLSNKAELGLAVDYLPKVRAADRETAVLHLLADLRREFEAGNRSAVAVTDSPREARDINDRMQIIRAIANNNYDEKTKRLRQFAHGGENDRLAPGDPVRLRYAHWGFGNVCEGETGIVESVTWCHSLATVTLDQSGRKIRVNLAKWKRLLELTYALPVESEHVESYERKLRFQKYGGRLRELVVREEFREVGELAISQRQKEKNAAREEAARTRREQAEIPQKKREKRAQEERRIARENAEKLKAELKRKEEERVLEEQKALQQSLKDNPKAAAILALIEKRREEEREASEREEFLATFWDGVEEEYQRERRKKQDRESAEKFQKAVKKLARENAEQRAQLRVDLEAQAEQERREIAEREASWSLIKGPPISSSGFVPAQENTYRHETPGSSTNFGSGCNALQPSSHSTGTDYYTYGSAQAQHTTSTTQVYTPVASPPSPRQHQPQTVNATVHVTRHGQAQSQQNAISTSRPERQPS